MRKSTRLIALATSLLLTLASPAAAVNVQLNGQPLAFDVPPVVDNGRTLVPVRAIFEALGARITWDPDSQTVSAVHPERDKYVILVLGSTTAWVDGVEITLDVAPKSIDGRTMVPLRFISTAMGADVQWDAATETAIITQAPLESATPEGSATEEPSAALTLAQYTRSIAYEQLEETWYCAVGTERYFDDFYYLFHEEDPEYFAETMHYLGEKLLCWEIYQSSLLDELTPPSGAEGAHEALQKWVTLNRETLQTLGAASRAHTARESAERDHLFEEAAELYEAAVAQEQVMLEAMNALTSPDPTFLSVVEHQYVAWLDDMLGLTESCLSQVNAIGTGYMELSDAEWARFAADCWLELPETLSEKETPTLRMDELQQAVFAELVKYNADYTTLASQMEAGELTSEQVEAAVGRIWERWAEELHPALEVLMVYRTYGEQ